MVSLLKKTVNELPKKEIVRNIVQKSNIIFSTSGVGSSGISTLLYETSGLPSRAQSARRRIESFSPRLMLSSEVDGGNSGRVMPISSADSWRVDTDERRR